MKPSNYNFIWPTGDTGKVMVFNSLTTSLVETGLHHIDLLTAPGFDYAALPEAARQFVDRMQQGGFILEDEVNELKLLQFSYNSSKYDRRRLSLTVAPTLRCNFACTYCFEQAALQQDKRDGQAAFMPEAVQQALIHYIERAAKTVSGVHITWFGGEPLLGRQIISDLTKKIIAITAERQLDYSAQMVTNGYLLSGNPKIIQELKNSRITSFQITLDGPPEVHNNRRMLKAGQKPTFDQILNGIKLIKAHQMRVELRVNIDRFNMAAALELLDILEAEQLNDISVNLGQVTADTAGCKAIADACVTKEEFAALNRAFQATLRQKGFKKAGMSRYPRTAVACAANQINSLVVDPDGDLYKCWSEIGEKTARIGNITSFNRRSQSERMHEIRWLTWEPFERADCLACKFLPLCMGGCSYRSLFANTGRPDCDEWKYSLEYYVKDKFNREKAILAAGKQ